MPGRRRCCGRRSPGRPTRRCWRAGPRRVSRRSRSWGWATCCARTWTWSAGAAGSAAAGARRRAVPGRGGGRRGGGARRGCCDVNAFGVLAARGPALLVVDDGQWLDAASAEVLSWVVRRLPERLPLRLLLARRASADTLPLDLERALDDALLTRLAPAPLDEDAMYALVRERLVSCSGRRSCGGCTSSRAATRSSRWSWRGPAGTRAARAASRGWSRAGWRGCPRRRWRRWACARTWRGRRWRYWRRRRKPTHGPCSPRRWTTGWWASRAVSCASRTRCSPRRGRGDRTVCAAGAAHPAGRDRAHQRGARDPSGRWSPTPPDARTDARARGAAADALRRGATPMPASCRRRRLRFTPPHDDALVRRGTPRRRHGAVTPRGDTDRALPAARGGEWSGAGRRRAGRGSASSSPLHAGGGARRRACRGDMEEAAGDPDRPDPVLRRLSRSHRRAPATTPRAIESTVRLSLRAAGRAAHRGVASRPGRPHPSRRDSQARRPEDMFRRARAVESACDLLLDADDSPEPEADGMLLFLGGSAKDEARPLMERRLRQGDEHGDESPVLSASYTPGGPRNGAPGNWDGAARPRRARRPAPRADRRRSWDDGWCLWIGALIAASRR